MLRQSAGQKRSASPWWVLAARVVLRREQMSVVSTCALCAAMAWGGRTFGAEAAEIKMESPVSHQVVQRDMREGNGRMNVAFERRAETGERFEWRVVLLAGMAGTNTAWESLPAKRDGNSVAATIRVPAGGWYRLELRQGGAKEVLSAVEPVGVGEVFLIAGQSYAANCNDERLKVTDPQKRVACLDPKTGAWRVADDPQPGASDYKGGGSIWPPFGDELAKRLKVPVGWANAAVAATASQQWMPGSGLHENLLTAGKKLGAFRAVLWQQGESDVMAGTPTDTYIRNLTTIRASLVKEWGCDAVWMPAKSTIHPTVYNNPKQEAIIRDAIAQLWKIKGFHPGPDTDTLTGDNRGGPASKQHFSAKGQRGAAALWADAVMKVVPEARR